MKITYTPEDLKTFEIEIGECFKQKLIRAPIHLSDGTEEEIIKIFKNVNENDWIFCNWRAHYQCLLKGVNREILKKDIINGKSISLCYPEYKIFSSAIVGGNIPIATGIAFDIKRKNLNDKVYCFVGDMTSETGCFYENWKYSFDFDLPITFIIEDNGKSVCTDTAKTWHLIEQSYSHYIPYPSQYTPYPKIIRYKYTSKYPHAGTGQRIEF